MDWSVIDWPMIATQGLLVFISAFIANLFVVLVGDNRVVAALLAALIFCALLVGWTYFPLGLPLAARHSRLIGALRITDFGRLNNTTPPSWISRENAFQSEDFKPVLDEEIAEERLLEEPSQWRKGSL